MNTESHIPIEHKQRWHNSESYILPTDDEESARLQRQHDLICELFENRLVLCPLEIKSGDEVLDVGTGKAAWALAFLTSYPNASGNNAKIVCIDITDRIFPKSHPSNMSFHIHNVLDLPLSWTGHFAFVHQRLLMAALKKDEWDRAVKEVYRVTKGGGWVQFCECHMVSHLNGCGPVYAKFIELYKKVWDAVGLDYDCPLKIGAIMEGAGFVSVRTDHRLVQLGEWNGDIGTKHKVNMLSLFRGFKTPILKLGGLGVVKSEEDFDQLIENLEEELKGPGAVITYYVITGQKL